MGANAHNLETVRLPAALKRERKELFVGELNAVVSRDVFFEVRRSGRQ